MLFGPHQAIRSPATRPRPEQAVGEPVGLLLQLGERAPDGPRDRARRPCRVASVACAVRESVGGHESTLHDLWTTPESVGAPCHTRPMTALRVPLRPLTAAEYAALPEDSDHDYELQDGHVVMSAKPIPRHQRCLVVQLIRSAPPAAPRVTSSCCPMLIIDLELVPPDQPGTVRVPDLVIVTREAYERVRPGGRAASRRRMSCSPSRSTRQAPTAPTQVIKHAEYADAGIGHYWMVDLARGPGAHRLPPRRRVRLRPTSRRSRARSPPQHPFPARIDLDRLR